MSVKLYSVFLHYYPEAREGKSFDTDEMSFGTRQVKEIREISIDLENDSEVTLRLFTDLPGHAQALRTTETIEAGTGRRWVNIRFTNDAIYKGQHIKIVMSGTGYQVYDMKCEIKMLGTYLFGDLGETYNSDEIDFGVERVKMLKELELDCDNAANTTLSVATDLGAGAFSYTLAPTTGRESVKRPLPHNVLGRKLQVILEPTGDLDIRNIRAWVKTIGEPNASSWTWLEFPLLKTQDGIWTWQSVPVDDIG